MSIGKNPSKKIATNYGDALFFVAKKRDLVTKIKVDLEIIRSFFIKFPKPKKILASPIVKNKEQDILIALISSELKISQEIKNLLLLLIKNNRLTLLDEIIDYFILLALQIQGGRNIFVTTSLPLLDKTRNFITDELNKIFKCPIHLIEKVKPGIIGGIIITDGTKMYDASIKNKLNLIKRLSKQQIFSA